ncbi:MAG: hypothetical protein HY901_27865 [Deltaproteobacteria bacterium]|nr:hypothetical protein [Deltaproteobacteria bacterium]
MNERPGDVVVPSTGDSGTEARPEGWSSEAKTGAAPESDFKTRSKERARRYGGLAREQFLKRTDRRKGVFASELENLATTITETGASLERRGLGSQKRVADGAADRLRGFSRQLRESSTEDLARRAEEEFRARPAVTIAGLFGLGFLAARFLRS